MRRVFLVNLALLLALNLLVKPFYILGIDAGVQDAVGAETYGGYAALLSLSFLLNILLDLGITNYNTRNIARHGHLMGKYLGGMAAVRVLLMVFYALCTVGAGLVLGYRGAQLGMLGWLVLNQALVATVLYLRSNIAGAQRFRQDSLLSVLDRAFLIGVLGWLLWGRGPGAPFRIEWFVWAQTGAYGLTALVALGMTLRLSGRVRPGWRPALGLLVLRRSFPYALLILLMTFYYRTDTLMLERMLPDGPLQAGIYAQAFRFFEALNMLGFLMAGLLLPLFSRMLKERGPVAPLAGTAFRLVWAGTLPVAVLGGLYAREVMDLRYTEHTGASAPVFAVLMGCFVAVCTTYVFGTLLTASGDLRLLNWMAAGGMVLNIGLNLVLIPRYQVLGAAWASLITQVATAIAQLLLSSARFQLWPAARAALGPLLYPLVLAGAAVLARSMALPLGSGVLLVGSLAVVAAFLTGTLRWGSLRRMLPQAGPGHG